MIEGVLNADRLTSLLTIVATLTLANTVLVLALISLHLRPRT